MARHNRRSKTGAPKTRPVLLILLISAIIVGLILAAVGFYARLRHFQPETVGYFILCIHEASHSVQKKSLRRTVIKWMANEGFSQKSAKWSHRTTRNGGEHNEK